MEESFTVHLGTQLKRTHNLRLMCGLRLAQHNQSTIDIQTGDMSDLVRVQPMDGTDQHQAQRVMTSLALFSNKLSAAVLIVDGKLGRLGDIAACVDTLMIPGSDGVTSEFERNCEAVGVVLSVVIIFMFRTGHRAAVQRIGGPARSIAEDVCGGHLARCVDCSTSSPMSNHLTQATTM